MNIKTTSMQALNVLVKITPCCDHYLHRPDLIVVNFHPWVIHLCNNAVKGKYQFYTSK